VNEPAISFGNSRRYHQKSAMSDTPAAHRPPPPPAKMAAVPWHDELTGRVAAALAGEELQFETYLGQNFIVLSAARILDAVRFLHSSEQFDFLVDLTVVDYPKDTKRFELIYILYSFPRNSRVRLKTRVAENESPLSITSVFKGADWLEREAFDMFGVRFQDHPNLKRILLPDEWQGHPLRKDASIIGMDNEWVQAHLGIESGQ
jgi:NADH-quinone oxidoreductase subunit C